MGVYLFGGNRTLIKPSMDPIDFLRCTSGNEVESDLTALLASSMMTVRTVHVLHVYSSPHTDNKRFDLAFVLTPSDAEVPVLTPVLPPGVGGNLKSEEMG